MVSRARLGSLGLIESANIAVGAVTSNSLANSSVTNAKIAGNAITSDKIASSVTTSAIAESVLNLYFSNDRARAAFTAGSGINITGGVISSAANANTIIALVSGIFESQAFTGDGNAVFVMNRTVTGPANIFVHVNGLTAVPNVDYTVSGNVLTLTSNSISNSYIDVRYFRLV